MSFCEVPRWMRRAAICLIPSVAMLLAAASSNAQNTDAGALANAAASFSSSTDGALPSSDASAEGSPAAAQDNTNSYPRYHHENRLALELGGGFNAPSGNTSNYLSWGGNLTAGAGYKFNQHLSALVEYQYIDDKLPGPIISEAGANGGDAHIWSFGIAPVVDLFPKKKHDVYVTGGGGFYRKVTNFTDPVAVFYCDYFCGGGYANAVVGHFSSNQGGWNVGAGYTFRIGGYRDPDAVKLFAEARYLDVLTPAVNGVTPDGLGVTSIAADTKLIPVTLGVRF